MGLFSKSTFSPNHIGDLLSDEESVRIQDEINRALPEPVLLMGINVETLFGRATTALEYMVERRRKIADEIARLNEQLRQTEVAIQAKNAEIAILSASIDRSPPEEIDEIETAAAHFVEIERQ